MWSLWTLSHTIIVVRLTDNYGPFSIALSRYTVESFKSLLPSLLFSRLSIRCDVLGLIVSASIIIPQALRHSDLATLELLAVVDFPASSSFQSFISLDSSMSGAAGGKWVGQFNR